jgi:ketosteroid isomerase-like protein
MTEGRAGGAEEARGAQERGTGPEETRGAQEPGTGAVARSPREVAEDVRRMVAGEDVVFADLFAEDAVFTYPFAIPGGPAELIGREAIRGFFGSRGQARSLFRMDGVDAVIRETDDPEVVVAEIRHHGWSHVTNAPYQHTALGVIRVRDGLIVRYDDYMNPIAVAQLLGRTDDLVTALSGG